MAQSTQHRPADTERWRPTSRKRRPISSRRWPTRRPTSSTGLPIRSRTWPAASLEQGREAGEQVQEVAGNIKGAVDKSVKDQPMATLAVVAALGFVLGALWKS